jgi:hypothetical protein
MLLWVERMKINKTLEKLHGYGAKAMPKLKVKHYICF